MIPIVTPQQLAEELKSEHKPVLLDVREAHELAVSKLDIDHHIPLGELPSRLSELDPNADIVIVCRSGARSGRATEFLLSLGFRSVRNLSSGMNGWSRDVDPSVQMY
jgi:adenylyltransferase/sulfurtransferase